MTECKYPDLPTCNTCKIYNTCTVTVKMKNYQSKIYYNINESTYIYETENFKFYFSSDLYLSKFIERYLPNRRELLYKLNSRYNIEVQAFDYCDIILYNQIEKRGFKMVEIETGDVFQCLRDIIMVCRITKQTN